MKHNHGLQWMLAIARPTEPGQGANIMSTSLWLRCLMLGLATLLIIGCAPYINSYYLPDSDVGYLSGHSKRTSDQPLWILERGGATLYFSADRNGDGNSTFKLTIQPFRLPGEASLSAKKRDEARARVKPVTVDFTKLREDVMVTSNGNRKGASSVLVVKGQYGTNNRYIVTLPTNVLHLPVDHYLEVSAFVQGGQSDVYVVEWPSMVINGKSLQLPQIKFQWKSGIQVQFVNG